MSTELLPHIELNPAKPATATVIWLHGLGASGDDFVPIIPELDLPEDLAIRFIFPHAPEMPVTINGGYIMPAWYDITAMSIEREIDEQQLFASSAAIAQFIDREIARGIASERIILAGFSLRCISLRTSSDQSRGVVGRGWQSAGCGQMD
jgi:phospholipase/carboxylesterase